MSRGNWSLYFTRVATAITGTSRGCVHTRPLRSMRCCRRHGLVRQRNTQLLQVMSPRPGSSKARLQNCGRATQIPPGGNLSRNSMSSSFLQMAPTQQEHFHGMVESTNPQAVPFNVACLALGNLEPMHCMDLEVHTCRIRKL